MKFSYNLLKKYTDIKLTPEKLAELLTLHSFECVVSEKADGLSAQSGDAILNIDILPNRTHDTLSHYGLAKEIAALTGKPVKKPDLKFFEDRTKRPGDFISVTVVEKQLCPRYIAKVITDVKISPAPKWLQDELVKFDINPHNNIVDILNYAMLETGQPMHVFDYEKLEGKKIIIRKAKRGEKINTLDGGQYDLDESVLVIADGVKPVAIAGIKGGLETGVFDKTTTIVIESANFEPGGIRKTDKNLGLNTDASIRFAAGIDPNLAELGLNRVCALIQEIIPGSKIIGGTIDIYPKKLKPRNIKLNLEYLDKLIGEKIKPEFTKRTLESLGIKISAKGAKIFLATVPTERLDLEAEEDLIEEVARFYGYENLIGKVPAAAMAVPEKNYANIAMNKARDILASAGFSETYNYSFVGGKNIDENGENQLVEIQNPANSDFKYLRPELNSGLLKNVKNNFRFAGEIKLFEIGNVFSSPAEPKENLRLAGVSAVKRDEETINGAKFFEMKGVLNALFENLGVVDCRYVSTTADKWWHPGRVARIEHGGGALGIIGEVSPAALASLGIVGRVAMFNIDFERLATIVNEEREFSQISKYPAVVRDISILVDKDIRMSEVLGVIHNSGAEFIEDINLFDYYEGKELSGNKKNLAFHIVFQAERTLTDEEIRREEEKIKNALIKKLSAEIR